MPSVFVGHASVRLRQLLVGSIDRHRSVSVVGAASSLSVVASRIQRHRPDVLLLDIGIVSQDEKVARTVLTSQPTLALVPQGFEPPPHERRPLVALAAGRFTLPADILNSPSGALSTPLVTAILGLSRATLPPTIDRVAVAPVVSRDRGPRIIALGTSTGGVTALTRILPMFPSNAPPIVVVDHMPGRLHRRSGPASRRRVPFPGARSHRRSDVRTRRPSPLRPVATGTCTWFAQPAVYARPSRCHRPPMDIAPPSPSCSNRWPGRWATKVLPPCSRGWAEMECRGFWRYGARGASRWRKMKPRRWCMACPRSRGRRGRRWSSCRWIRSPRVCCAGVGSWPPLR